MSPARKSRHLKRLAAIYERKAGSQGFEPWALRNIRTYQQFMVDALTARSKLLLGYLAQRSAR